MKSNFNFLWFDDRSVCKPNVAQFCLCPFELAHLGILIPQKAMKHFFNRQQLNCRLFSNSVGWCAMRPRSLRNFEHPLWSNLRWPTVGQSAKIKYEGLMVCVW